MVLCSRCNLKQGGHSIMNFTEIIPFLSGLICALAVVLFAKYRRKKRFAAGGKYQYDERQIAEQGKACRWGMYTAVLFSFVLGCAQDAGLAVSGIFASTCCIALTMLVFASVCIFKDAYFYTSAQPRFYTWYFLVLGVVATAFGVCSVMADGAIIDGVITSKAVMLPIGIMCLGITVVILIKRAMDKKTEAE